MVIRKSIETAKAKANVPATIHEASGLLHIGDYEGVTKILIDNPPLVQRMQAMADRLDIRAGRAMAHYRWRRFGVHPITGEELGPQTGPCPGIDT